MGNNARRRVDPTARRRRRRRTEKHVTRTPHIIGSAVSGTVIGLGQQVDGFRLGNEVMVIPDKEPEADS
jgi:NADPH:quinone reductase-like Zn-dependent oxidoreductase